MLDEVYVNTHVNQHTYTQALAHANRTHTQTCKDARAFMHAQSHLQSNSQSPVKSGLPDLFSHVECLFLSSAALICGCNLKFSAWHQDRGLPCQERIYRSLFTHLTRLFSHTTGLFSNTTGQNTCKSSLYSHTWRLFLVGCDFNLRL